MVATAIEYATVPRMWPDSTIVVLATGPSLCQADVDACRGRARVIAIKDAIQLAPWVDVLYSCGSDIGLWWHKFGPGLSWYHGLRYTLDPNAAEWAQVLRNTGYVGLETDPSGLRTGKNSGYQSIGLARHLGAARIVLLGFDAEGTTHFFGPHRDSMARPNLRDFAPLFETLVEPLTALGVEVLNASRQSQITAFQRVSLEEALSS